MALACSLNKDILKGTNCEYKLNSVTEIWLAQGMGATITMATGSTTDECKSYIDDIKLSGKGNKWYHIIPEKNTASYSDVLNVTDAGAKYRTHTLSFTIGDADPCVIDGLVFGSYLAIAVFADGSAIMLGTPTAPLEATAVNQNGAANPTEASGVSVEMSREVTQTALPISKGKLATITGAAAVD